MMTLILLVGILLVLLYGLMRITTSLDGIQNTLSYLKDIDRHKESIDGTATAVWEVRKTLKDIQEKLWASNTHLEKLEQYVHTFWREKDSNDRMEYAKHQQEMKERNKERRLKKEEELKNREE